MKSNLYVEYQDVQMEQKEFIATAKEIWTETGKKLKDLHSLDLYVKPEERAVYYVMNEDMTGHFSF